MEEVLLDEIAATRLSEFILSSDNAEMAKDEVCLRLGVLGGGCAGFQYKLTLDTEQDGDHRFQSFEQAVLVDPETLEFVRGSTITYTDGLNGTGFEVINPRASSACGCGSSFTLDDKGCDQISEDMVY